MDSRSKGNAKVTGIGCLPEKEALGRADSHRLGHTPTCTQHPPEHLLGCVYSVAGGAHSAACAPCEWVSSGCISSKCVQP